MGASKYISLSCHKKNILGIDITPQAVYIYPTLSDPPHSLFKLILLDFSLTVKAVTLIFISGRGSAISSAEHFIYTCNLVKS